MAFTNCSTVTNRISTLDDLPNDVGGLTPAQLKAVFDQFGAEFVAWFNATHIVEGNAHLADTAAHSDYVVLKSGDQVMSGKLAVGPNLYAPVATLDVLSTGASHTSFPADSEIGLGVVQRGDAAGATNKIGVLGVAITNNVAGNSYGGYFKGIYGTYVNKSIGIYAVGAHYAAILDGITGIGTNTPGYILDVQHATHKMNSKNGYLTNGADYGEYFESVDGAAIPLGTSVILVNEKIRPAQTGELPIGAISATCSLIGNNDSRVWYWKYQIDEWGRILLDEVGEPVLNPDYNPDIEFVARGDRPEWNVVGLLGQVRIAKGQPTAPSWIKLKDINENVELWLIK